MNLTNIENLIQVKSSTKLQKKTYITKEKKEQKNKILNNDSEIILTLVILDKIKIYKKDITKIKLKDFGEKLDLRLINKNDKFNISFRNLVKDLKMEIEKLDLKVEISTEDAMVTTFVVAGISTLLSILLRKYIKNKKKQQFIVIPKFIDENLLKIYVSGIFQIDLLHYINSIVLRKKGNRYERTSNRRAYDYSYE